MLEETRRDCAGYPPRRTICRRPRAWFDQHCSVGAICLLGRNHSRLVVAPGVDRRFAGASCRKPAFAWLGSVSKQNADIWKVASRDGSRRDSIWRNCPRSSVQELQRQLSEDRIACSTCAAKPSGWPATLTEQAGGRSIASGFLLPRLISIFPWQCIARVDIAA